jgi:predicted component of type VI protein secretion system
MGLSLVVLTAGKQQGQVLQVKPPQFLVGRDPGCHLRPASHRISNRHCALQQRDGKAFPRDLGSAGGTFVNDRPVQGEVELHHGDRLRIGPLLFAVRLGAATPVSTPAGQPPARAADANRAGAPAAPPPAAAPESGAEDEDSIAALLLSSEGDQGSDAPAPGGGVASDSAAPGPEAPAATREGSEPSEPSGKGSTAQPADRNTSTAAKAILQRYRTRPHG